MVALLLLVTGLASAGRTAAGQGAGDTVVVAVKDAAPSWTIGAVSLQAGVVRLDLDELNAVMAASGRPTISTDLASIGIAGHARFGRWLIGGSGEVASQRRVAAGWINTASFGSAMVDAGMAVIDGPRLLVYPQVSLGIRQTTLRIEQTGSFAYDAAVTSPARGVSLSSFGALAGVGLVTELHFATRRTGAFSVGLHAGYRTPLGAASTSSGESSVSGAPRQPGGQFLRLSVGKPFGSRSSALGLVSTAVMPWIAR
jgi:hypothetical protein